MSIGKKLVQLRNNKHLTQDQIADVLGVKRPRYNAWENGISKPDIDMVKKIAEYHQVSVDYLLGTELPSELREEAAKYEISKRAISKDFKKMLEEDTEIMFDGIPLDEEDKEKVMRVMEAIFWDAKKKNKENQ